MMNEKEKEVWAKLVTEMSCRRNFRFTIFEVELQKYNSWINYTRNQRFASPVTRLIQKSEDRNKIVHGNRIL